MAEKTDAEKLSDLEKIAALGVRRSEYEDKIQVNAKMDEILMARELVRRKSRTGNPLLRMTPPYSKGLD